MPSLLAMEALPEILLLVSLIISLIISLVPLWTFADFADSAASAFFLCKEQSFWSKPILSLDCGFRLNELGDDLIGRGGFLSLDARKVFPNLEDVELQL
jgi:hypothetical protein